MDFRFYWHVGEKTPLVRVKTNFWHGEIRQREWYMHIKSVSLQYSAMYMGFNEPGFFFFFFFFFWTADTEIYKRHYYFLHMENLFHLGVSDMFGFGVRFQTALISIFDPF